MTDRKKFEIEYSRTFSESSFDYSGELESVFSIGDDGEYQDPCTRAAFDGWCIALTSINEPKKSDRDKFEMCMLAHGIHTNFRVDRHGFYVDDDVDDAWDVWRMAVLVYSDGGCND